jgi:hypothetical protein
MLDYILRRVLGLTELVESLHSTGLSQVRRQAELANCRSYRLASGASCCCEAPAVALRHTIFCLCSCCYHQQSPAAVAACVLLGELAARSTTAAAYIMSQLKHAIVDESTCQVLADLACTAAAPLVAARCVAAAAGEQYSEDMLGATAASDKPLVLLQERLIAVGSAAAVAFDGVQCVDIIC